jgi:hypothetical protein
MSESQALKVTLQPEAKPARKFFGGLVEGIRSWSARSAIDDLLREASPESVCAAIKKFSLLDEKSKRKALLCAEAALEHQSSFPFEYPNKVKAVTAIGWFFTEAAKQLPLDENGARISAPYEKAIYLLSKIAAENNLYDPQNLEHRAARLACTEALWELEGGSREFWQDRLFDDATSIYTLLSLLSDPDRWDLLKDNLDKVALAVATCPSDKKTDFLQHMLNDEKPEVIKIALAASIYLDSVPKEFFERALEISRLGSELNLYVRVFNEACHFKGMLVYADDRQFHGAMGLISMYQGGVDFLPPLLHKVGHEMVDLLVNPAGASEQEKEANRGKAGQVLAHLAMAGIRIPGVQIDFN